ncbi:uncharacterized protein LOC143180211 [Calliopsis andreniformis]|uniref:uncharacterized protein LOC143180211 n=1 Tax=Calliopsis andreniformis TaxID=337506 RepID=UPI003FCE17FF
MYVHTHTRMYARMQMQCPRTHACVHVRTYPFRREFFFFYDNGAATNFGIRRPELERSVWKVRGMPCLKERQKIAIFSESNLKKLSYITIRVVLYLSTEFKYVIQKQEQQKVCFGSGRFRDTSRKGMSPFMKYHTLEDHPNVAPNSYDTLRSFKAVKTKPCCYGISKRGYGGIARFGRKIVTRDDYPSPLDYNVPTFPEQASKTKYPFGSGSKRQTFVGSTVPGPGTYVTVEKGGITFEHSFGGRVKMKLGVDLKCCSQNTDVCKICGERPKGDYWHLKNTIFLCKSCMEKEYKEQRKYRRTKLKSFRKIRDCSVIHQHEATTAKIWLTHPTVVAQWLRKEAYLSVYFKRVNRLDS